MALEGISVMPDILRLKKISGDQPESQETDPRREPVCLPWPKMSRDSKALVRRSAYHDQIHKTSLFLRRNQ